MSNKKDTPDGATHFFTSATYKATQYAKDILNVKGELKA